MNSRPTLKTALPCVLLAAFAMAVDAGPVKFDFKDAKGVNTVNFNLDAPLEAISGTANGIAGEVHFDPAQPAATKGRITLETASLQVPNAMMKDHMLGKEWMDTAAHPQIVFEIESLANASTAGDVTTADAKGTLSVKGVKKPVSIPVKITHLKDKLGARTNGRMQGDLLVVRAKFTIKRTDYGINPKAPEDKVSDTVELTLSVAGAAPKG